MIEKDLINCIIIFFLFERELNLRGCIIYPLKDYKERLLSWYFKINECDKD